MAYGHNVYAAIFCIEGFRIEKVSKD